MKYTESFFHLHFNEDGKRHDFIKLTKENVANKNKKYHFYLFATISFDKRVKRRHSLIIRQQPETLTQQDGDIDIFHQSHFQHRFYLC